jgi:hypothetical protein
VCPRYKYTCLHRNTPPVVASCCTHDKTLLTLHPDIYDDIYQQSICSLERDFNINLSFSHFKSCTKKVQKPKIIFGGTYPIDKPIGKRKTLSPSKSDLFEPE